MDYEKAYKEALSRAKSFELPEYKNIMASIFPELAESEDEKIRNALIRFHKSTIDVDGIKGADIIAWLEKQDEQKPILDFKASNWYVSKVDGKIHDMTYNPANKVESKAGEKIEDEIEIPFGAKDSELQEETYFIPKGFHAEIEDDKVVIEKGEKSAVWSDEDEKMYKIAFSCIETLEDISNGKNMHADVKDWLKSLKERIGG